MIHGPFYVPAGCTEEELSRHVTEHRRHGSTVHTTREAVTLDLIRDAGNTHEVWIEIK